MRTAPVSQEKFATKISWVAVGFQRGTSGVFTMRTIQLCQSGKNKGWGRRRNFG